MVSGRPDYTQASLIRGNCTGVGLVTVAVDAAGNILGILQGDYAGDLKTLAVDGQGRMLAVLTDPEDVFGNPHYMGAAELAARLGSPAILERRGQVVFMDPGGSNVAQYILTSAGVDSTAVESGAMGPSGPLSYKMTAGPDNGNWVALTRRSPLLTLSGSGVEAVVQLSPDMKSCELDLTVATGTGIWYGMILINKATGKIQYLNSAYAWVDLADIPSSVVATDHHLLKLTMNPTTGKYGRFRCDNTVWDLSAIAMYFQAGATSQQIAGRVSLTCGASGTISVYLGAFILTVNEE